MDFGPFVESLHRPEVRAGLGIAFMVFVLSHIPVLGWPLYPLSLFGVYVHELWHGITGMLTGGRFERFVINPGLSGVALVWGGVDLVVDSAGYVGTAFTGALLLVAASSDIPPRTVLLVLGVGLGILCLLFVRNAFGMVAGLALAVAFVIASQRLHEFWQQVGLWFLGVQLLIDTVSHLVLLTNYASNPAALSDAHRLGKMTGIHPFLWILFWLLLVFVGLLYALNRAYQIPLPWGG
jgi:hypothetical protein